MALVKTNLMRWRAAGGGPLYEVNQVLDDADFEVDAETGEPNRRVIRFEITTPRGGEFIHRGRGLPHVQQMVGPQLLRVVPVTGPRQLENEFRWDFTPDHVPVMPGSVSNPATPPLTSGGNAVGGPLDTTGLFTPTADALLVGAWSARHTGSPIVTFSFSNTHAGSGAWAAVEVTSGGIRRHSQSYSQVGPSPGIGTVTNTYGGTNPIRTSWIISEITGHDTTTPVSESSTAIGNATTLAVTLTSIAAGNLAIGTIASLAAASITPGTNETEVAEVSSGGTGPIITQMEYGTDTNVDWSGLATTANLGVAIEYAQAATGDAPFRVTMGGY